MRDFSGQRLRWGWPCSWGRERGGKSVWELSLFSPSHFLSTASIRLASTVAAAIVYNTRPGVMQPGCQLLDGPIRGVGLTQGLHSTLGCMRSWLGRIKRAVVHKQRHRKTRGLAFRLSSYTGKSDYHDKRRSCNDVAVAKRVCMDRHWLYKTTGGGQVERNALALGNIKVVVTLIM